MLAVGDAVWNALITGVVAIVLAWIGLIANRKKLNEIAEVGKTTHTLVNANMAAQLKISAVALRTVATLQPTPENIAAAELAEKLLQEHEVKQASVDAKEKQ